MYVSENEIYKKLALFRTMINYIFKYMNKFIASRMSVVMQAIMFSRPFSFLVRVAF